MEKGGDLASVGYFLSNTFHNRRTMKNNVCVGESREGKWATGCKIHILTHMYRNLRELH